MTEISFVVPGVPSTLNVVLRRHWAFRDRERREWADKVKLVLYANGLRDGKPVFGTTPVRLTLRYSLKSNRAKLDLDNRVPKHLCDAMAGYCYADDSQIAVLIQSIERGAKRDETFVLVEPAHLGWSE